MPSAIDFLPLRIRSLTNFETSRSWNFGSGRILRLATTRRRGMRRVPFLNQLAGALGAVFRTALLAALDSDGIEGAADDVVPNARKVLHPAAADHHHRVLLEIVAHARNIGRHLNAIGQAHACNLAQGGVRLLRGGG